MQPLAHILRPKQINDMVGQSHLLAEGKPIRIFLENKHIPSLLFRGPPGTGKTTLAQIIATQLQSEFFSLSGVTSKKEDLQKIIHKAKTNKQYGIQTIIFLDEIHRRNKAQQDTLLPFVEDGTIILIGATTENPSFTVNNALLSRCRVFVFEALTPDDIATYIEKQKEKIIGLYPTIDRDHESIHYIAELANGDLRSALNILQTAIMLQKAGKIQKQIIQDAIKKSIYYDKKGEEHYNIISAVHKSLRDSDAHAAAYWTQRMLVGGEDPLYIVRRLIRFASEDIGNADTQALILAQSTYAAVEKIGMPESDVIILQLIQYLAHAPKDNTCYITSQQTKQDIHTYGNLPVPLHLRNAPTKFMKDLNYGKGYQYAHDFVDAKVEQEHFPEQLRGRVYGKQ